MTKPIQSTLGLIATAVLGMALLSYCIIGNGNMTDEGRADRITAASALLQEAVISMVAGGTAPEKITFIGTGEHASTDVFDSGKIKADDITPPSKACSPDCANWTFLSPDRNGYGWYVYGMGTAAADIIVYLSGITPSACRQIQESLGYKNITPPKQAGAPFNPLKRGYYDSDGSSTTIKFENEVLAAQGASCFDNRGTKNSHAADEGPDNYAYYFVLYGQ